MHLTIYMVKIVLILEILYKKLELHRVSWYQEGEEDTMGHYDKRVNLDTGWGNVRSPTNH